MKEQFKALFIQIKALKKAAPWAKVQLAEKAVFQAAQTIETMIDEIHALRDRVAELEGGRHGE